jgi:hypothetical protein
MDRSRLALFLASLAALGCQDKDPPGSIIQARCVDPTPNNPAWYHTTYVPNPDGSSRGIIPSPPDLSSGLVPSRWPGTYRLLLVHTVGPLRGDSILARVVLEMDSTGTDSSIPLLGSATIVGGWPSYLSFAPDSAAKQDRQVSVGALYHTDPGSLTFVLGNPGLRWTDSGVLLSVFQVTDSGFIGRWVDGGLGVQRDSATGVVSAPQGYFCLTRENAS